MTSKSCPFCGDPRRPRTEEHRMEFERVPLFYAECQCCGAQGPMADNRGSALILWDERHTPETQKQFMDLSDRLTPGMAELIERRRKEQEPWNPSADG